MAMNTLHDLMVDELRDMYHAENQLLKALPNLANVASTPALKQAIEHHLAQTQHQVERIETIFQQLGGSPKGKRCKGMEGILEEGDELLHEKGPDAVLDAALIASAQRVEHYEIAAYGCIRAYATLLGLDEVAKLANQTLEEEEAADRLLTSLADDQVNAQAAQAAR